MTAYSEIADRIRDADALLITASNGMSITEGLHIFANNQAFHDVFGDFESRYGVRNILDGMFYRWSTLEEKWAFISRLVNHYCNGYSGSPAMSDLKEIVGDKPYFILTSNMESHFELAGFDPSKVFEVEGNLLNMRCGRGCTGTLYPTMELMRKMADEQHGCRIPSSLVPHCPECGVPMVLYNAMPPDDGIRLAWERFLKDYSGKKVVVLELGIGMRNQLIKAPIMRLVAEEPRFTYVTINLGEVFVNRDIADRSYGLDSRINISLEKICDEMSQGGKLKGKEKVSGPNEMWFHLRGRYFIHIFHL